MNVWPLVFSYRSVIRTEGFTAKIHAVSRVLAEEQEDGSIWLNGAEPGGFAAGGEDFDAAHTNLRAAFHSIVRDTAEEAETFDVFFAEMDRFLRDGDRTATEQWRQAWLANREGRLDREPVGLLKELRGQETATLMDVVRFEPPQVDPAQKPAAASKAAPASDQQLAVAA